MYLVSVLRKDSPSFSYVIVSQAFTAEARTGLWTHQKSALLAYLHAARSHRSRSATLIVQCMRVISSSFAALENRRVPQDSVRKTRALPGR